MLTILAHDSDVHAIADLDVEGGLLLLHLVEQPVCKMRNVILWGRRCRLARAPSRGQTSC